MPITIATRRPAAAATAATTVCTAMEPVWGQLTVGSRAAPGRRRALRSPTASMPIAARTTTVAYPAAKTDSPSISSRESCRGAERAGCGRLVGFAHLNLCKQLEVFFAERVVVLAAVDDTLDTHPDQRQNAAGDEQHVAG